MKHIHTFESFLNESAIKVPSKISDVDELHLYFDQREEYLAKEIWGRSANSITLEAKNNKMYKITYVGKDFNNRFLKL